MASGTISLNTNDSGVDQNGIGYCKMPDGTLMCWGSYDGNAASTTQQGNLYVLVVSLNIVFPVEFYAKPSVAFSPSNDPYSIPVSGVAFTKTGITQIALARPNNSSITPRFSWIAIGRWKA